MKHTLLRLTASLMAAAVLTACSTQDSRHTQAQAPHAAATANSTLQALQVQRQALATALYELAYSPKQNVLFVASAGGFGADAPASKILRLNPDTLGVQAEITLERKGFGLALDDAANRLYIGNTSDASVSVMDTTTNQVIGTVQLAGKIKAIGPNGKEREVNEYGFRQLVIDAKNHRLFAPGYGAKGSAVYVVDTRSLKVEKILKGFGYLATGISLDKHAGKAYVSNLQGQLFVINTRTLEIEQKFEVKADQLLNLVLDHKRGRILATDQGHPHHDKMRAEHWPDYKPHGSGNRVVVLSPADGSLLGSIPTGENPIALLLDDVRDRLYVTNRGSGTVTVFDANDYRLLHTIELPSHPNSLALDRASGAVFISIKNGEQDAKGSHESVARIQF